MRHVKRSTVELSGFPPSWNRTNTSRLDGEVTALCSVGSGYGAWQVAVPVGAEAPSFEAK